MKDLVCSKEEFLKQLRNDPFVKNVREDPLVIHWEEPDPKTHFINYKMALTYLTPQRIQALYKHKYGEYINRETAKRIVKDLGYEIGKVGKKQVFIDCVECR